MDVLVGGRRIRVSPSMSIGKGGEADIYDIGNGQVLKLFKTPKHPDIIGDRELEIQAQERLDTHQRKLREFPKNLPATVVVPIELATDTSGASIVGYTMGFISGGEVLYSYGKRAFRANGVSSGECVSIFRNLHSAVEGVHDAHVVIGDFNDLNVMVVGENPRLLDADSFQFGPFLCKTYTGMFVDPLCCDKDAHSPVLVRPHNANSDWYAFAVMLFRTLLFVDPFGGIYRPKSKNDQVLQGARALRRISVFHPQVQYPKPALPYGHLPDDLLDYFKKVFEHDLRGRMPQQLLESLRFTQCLVCKTEHARAVCPVCASVAPAAVRSTTVIRGQVTATRLFRTSGVILLATVENGALRYIYHDGSNYRREDDEAIVTGPLDPHVRFALSGNATYFCNRNEVVRLSKGERPARISVDTVANRSTFTANSTHHYYSYDGTLLRDGAFGGTEQIGTVLAGQTRVWVGEKFGFGLYRAGEITVAFTFDAEHKGLNDNIKLPRITGQLIDARAYFTSDRVWFGVTFREGGKTLNRMHVLDRNGTLLGVAESEAGAGDWLGSIGGKCPSGSMLLCATDQGIVRVEIVSGTIAVTREFPDTEPFVDSDVELLPSKHGLYVISRTEITELSIK